MSEIALRFDYNSLSGGVATQAAKHAREIKTLTRKAVEDIVKIGDELTAVKSILPHGKFDEWLRVEFAWSERHARRLMQAAEKAKTLNLSDLDVSASALYLLSSDSVPDEAIAEVIESAKATGEKVTHKAVKRVVAKHTPAAEPKTDNLSVLPPAPESEDLGWDDEEETAPRETVVDGVSWVETAEDQKATLSDDDWNEAEADLKVEKDRKNHARGYLKAAHKSLAALQENCLNASRLQAKIDLKVVDSHAKDLYSLVEKARVSL